MSLRIPPQDDFEKTYTLKFKLLAAHYGIEINYEQDRAAIDMGLHLKVKDTLSNNRVWFQFKGLHAETLPAAEFNSATHVAVKDIKLEHLRAWYQSSEAVYLALYVESVDIFLVADVKTLVDNQWGDEILNPDLFGIQKTVTVHLPKTFKLNEARWQKMFRHSAMRTDGISFRGKPLGHPHNPLTSILLPMEPTIFVDLVTDLLSEHGFKAKEQLDAMELFAEAKRAENVATLTIGTLPHQFEAKLQITNQFMLDEGEEHLSEGQSIYFKGPCAVLIHSKVASCPEKTFIVQLAHNLKKRHVEQLIVFVNGNMIVEDMKGYCGYVYIGLENETGVKCSSQHLEDIAFNLCIATNTYHRFRDKVVWWGGAIWSKDKSISILYP